MPVKDGSGMAKCNGGDQGLRAVDGEKHGQAVVESR